MIHLLDHAGQLRLVEYACGFGWADGELVANERRLIERFAARMDLSGDERARLQTWLEQPLAPRFDLEEASPVERLVLLQAVESVLLADGRISREEQQLFDRFYPWA